MREREEPAKCATCGHSFTSNIIEQMVRTLPRQLVAPDARVDLDAPGLGDIQVTESWSEMVRTRHCEACVNEHHRKEDDARKGQQLSADDRKRRTFERICPPVYRTDGIRAAMPGDLVKSATDLVKLGRGVLCHGETGRFKTTAMFNGPVRWLVWTGHQVRYIRASQWRQDTSAAAKACELEAWLRPFMEVPWLFLDDIGHMNSTPSAEEALLEVLEVRTHAIGTARELPVIATTQFDGEALMNRFATPERGAAICRRLAMLTNPLDFDPPTP